MPNSFDISEIEAYLRNQMDGESRRNFEARMAADEALQKEVETYRQLLTGLDALQDANFAAEVKQWAKSSQSKRSKTGSMKQKKRRQAKTRQLNPMWRRIAVAASIVVIVFAAWMYFQGANQSNLQLAKNAYVAPMSSNTMGAQDDSGQVLVEQFEKGHSLFQEGKYEEAASALRDFITSVQNNKEAFDPLSRQFYLESAQWTVLLCDFATGKMDDEKMKKILSAMSKKTNSDYGKKAKELLEALEKRKG
ncbi:MAG: hypothetical protein CMN32_10790 [Saprospirales bacterium]|nr:hypothetical protein [Saprospirales bacterium]